MNQPIDIKLRLYREAVSDGTVALCWLVGRTLGSLIIGYDYLSVTHDGPLTIMIDDEQRCMTIRYRGILVCSTRKNNWRFLPGPWEDRVHDLAILARQKRERNEALRGLPT